jgi:uncharacterized protein YegL
MLLLDTSGSMSTRDHEDRRRIDALSDAVRAFVFKELPHVPAISGRGELAIGTFGSTPMRWHDLGRERNSRLGVDEQPFTLFSEIKTLPTFTAGGLTPLADAVEHGVVAMRRRVDQLRQLEVSLQYMPMIFLITDGRPSHGQDMDRAIRLLRDSAFRRPKPEFLFVSLGVHGADDDLMNRLAPRAYYPLRGVALQDLMKFITASIFTVTGGGGGRAAAPADTPAADFSDTRDEYDLINQTLETYRDFQF